MSNMIRPTIRRDQRGAINELLLVIILLSVLLLGAAGFGVWAFMGRQDYKNNSDKKAAVAVAADREVTLAAAAKQYAEEAKNPLATYIGPSEFGNVTVKYPKTWSGYVVELAKNNSKPIDAFFYPGIVPNVGDEGNSFALRLQLVSASYDQVMNQFSSLVKTGKVTAAAYTLPQVPNVVGSRVEGQVWQNKQGSMVVLPIRNMTLKIWTEANDYKADFDTYILENLLFSP